MVRDGIDAGRGVAANEWEWRSGGRERKDGTEKKGWHCWHWWPPFAVVLPRLEGRCHGRLPGLVLAKKLHGTFAAKRAPLDIYSDLHGSQEGPWATGSGVRKAREGKRGPGAPRREP